MEKVSIIQVGFGNAARIHREAFKRQGIPVENIIVIEKDPAKIIEAKKQGFRVFKSLNELNPRLLKKSILDICVPTAEHYSVLKEAVKLGAKKILVEKPMVSPEDVNKVRKLLREFDGRIVVNENYKSSVVTKEIKKQLRGKLPEIVVTEFSKNRRPDIERGRFIDKKLGAAGYEGPHQVVVASELAGAPIEIKEVKFEDMRLSDGTILPMQASVEIEYRSKRTDNTKLLSSMVGEIKHPTKPFKVMTALNDVKDPRHRYRILHVKADKGIEVIGIYEPIPGQPRSRASVWKFVKGIAEIRDRRLIDDSMGAHLRESIKFLAGEKKRNPYNPEKALKNVELLYSAVKKARESRQRVRRRR